MIGELLNTVGTALCDTRLVVMLATQATCCIAAGLAASHLWRRRAARAHRLLLVGLLASVIMPVSYLLVRHMGLGMLAPQTTETHSLSASIAEPTNTHASETLESDINSEKVLAYDPTEPFIAESMWPDSPTRDAGPSWPALFFGCSLATGLALFGRLLWQFILGRRLVNAAADVEADDIRRALEEARRRMGVEIPVRLRSSREVRSPLIWCWRRVPVLLVHRQTSGRPRHCDWVGIFCHELAHWKRLDHVTGLFCELLLCAVPWHPLLWWARGRLATLSEEACDDWALAGGRAGVDYAESLLSLSPQARMAVLPTVMGKEKAMKMRICRILKDRCGNPQAGTRWVVLVAIVTLGVSAAVAVAQPGPPSFGRGRGGFGPDGPANSAEVARPMRRSPMPESQRLVLEGRRNVLKRMLENLMAQRRQAEAELQEQGNTETERTQILRAELATIRNHIDTIEQQLQSVDQAQPLRPAGPAGPVRGGPRPIQNDPRQLRLQNRVGNLEARLRELEDQSQGDSEQAQVARQELRRAREELQMARQQINAPAPQDEGRPEPIQRRAPADSSVGLVGPARPQAQLQEQVQQLQSQVGNLNQKIEQLQRSIDQMVQQRPEGQSR
jgi:hypothetical protein